jgi:hypothetical protein
MLPRLFLIAACIAAPLAPAAAESIADTHERVWMPAGKTVHLFRPIKRDLCRETSLHVPAGKIRTHATAPKADCAAVASQASAAAGVRGAR